jgi:hypothetical protein
VLPEVGAVAVGFAEPALPLPEVVEPFPELLVGVALEPPGVELPAGNSVNVLGASGTGFESALATKVFSWSGVASVLLRSL